MRLISPYLRALTASLVALCTLVSVAHAEVMILKCGVFTFDVDTDRRTVFFAGGATSQQRVAANISQRSIEFPNPFGNFRHRIDRATLDFSTWTQEYGWASPGSVPCERRR